MQVNQNVWRGIYQLEGLRKDIAYNAQAGGEILIHYLVDYAIRKGEHTKTGNNDNLARAAYAVYNGGPSHLRRYRIAKTSQSLKKIDRSFWKKYQTIKQGDELAVAQCYGVSADSNNSNASRDKSLARMPSSNAQRHQHASGRQAATEQTAGATKTRIAETAHTSSKREAWLLAQNANSYTLQLVATSSKDSATQFIRKHKLLSRAAYFQYRRDGKRWFSVVYGMYPTRSQAKKAIASLPKAIRKSEPWIRQLKDIQDAIRSVRGG